MQHWQYILIGFISQLINGTLGMGYGTIETSLLLAIGITPVPTSAIVHISEVFVGAISGLMHYKFRNVNIKMFKKLLIPGILGAVAGAGLLVFFREYSIWVKKIILVYILILGCFIFYKNIQEIKKIKRIKFISPLGFVAGFLDAFGGGGWSTILVSTLVAGGNNPIYTIGSVALARLFVAFAGSIAFITLIGFNDLQMVGWVILGAIIAAPIGPYVIKYIPSRISTIIISILLILLSLKGLFLR